MMSDLNTGIVDLNVTAQKLLVEVMMYPSAEF